MHRIICSRLIRLTQKSLQRSHQQQQRSLAARLPNQKPPDLYSIADHRPQCDQPELLRKLPPYNTIWLRDHCRCTQCYNAATEQRALDAIPQVSLCEPKEVQFSDKGETLSVVWNDDHRSTYRLDWLRDNWHRQPSSTHQFHWKGDVLRSNGGIPSLSYAVFRIAPTDAVLRLARFLNKYGVACVTDVPTTKEATQKLCEQICIPHETFYGRFWQFSNQSMDYSDTAYTSMALGVHTDATYFSQTAGVQVFHLLEHNGDGGETVIVDGFHAAERLRQTDVQAFNFLAKTPIPHQFRDDQRHYYVEEPVLSVQRQKLKQVRFNVYDRAPLSNLTPDDVRLFYQAYQKFADILQRKENEFVFKLQPGTCLFIDNFRVLHGRKAFTGKRVICGCYLQRDEYLSKVNLAKHLPS